MKRDEDWCASLDLLVQHPRGHWDERDIGPRAGRVGALVWWNTRAQFLINERVGTPLPTPAVRGLDGLWCESLDDLVKKPRASRPVNQAALGLFGLVVAMGLEQEGHVALAESVRRKSIHKLSRRAMDIAFDKMKNEETQ